MPIRRTSQDVSKAIAVGVGGCSSLDRVQKLCEAKGVLPLALDQAVSPVKAASNTIPSCALTMTGADGGCDTSRFCTLHVP
jgi:hypothetical protein